MKYHNITTDDMLNGEGLRVVLWVAGCSHHCKGCQNPITWNPEDGIPFDQDAKEEIFKELEKDYIAGLTLSGGDPMFCSNKDEITLFAKEVKEKYPDKTIWMYTGDSWEFIKNYEIINYIDVIVDGEFIESLKDATLLWKGSSNQRVIDVQKSDIYAAEPKLYCLDHKYVDDDLNFYGEHELIEFEKYVSR